MPAYFFDSSALVKRFAQEQGSAFVLRLLRPSAKNRLYTARITEVEVCAALARRRKANVIDDQTDIPNVAEILAGVLRKIDPQLQPLLLAKLERLAARRYRTWATDHPDHVVKDGLLACADREEEIAKRVESLNPYASAIQDKLLTGNPELLDLNRTLFKDRPLKVQFAMQAAGERAGAAAWTAYAAGASDPSARELLQSCSALEQANADFLQTLL